MRPTPASFPGGLSAAWACSSLGVPTVARAQETCDEDLATARARYTEGRFEESTGLVLGCLNGGRLAADAVVPEYRADPVQDVPTYLSLVDIVRQQVDEDAASRVRRDAAIRGGVF